MEYTINLKPATKNHLKAMAQKEQTYDEIVCELLDIKDKRHHSMMPTFCSICNRKLPEHTDKDLVFCALKICED